MTFFLAPRRKRVMFVLKVVCPQYTFSLPDSGKVISWSFQNACRNLTFTMYLPPSNRVKAYNFVCSTLVVGNITKFCATSEKYMYTGAQIDFPSKLHVVFREPCPRNKRRN